MSRSTYFFREGANISQLIDDLKKVRDGISSEEERKKAVHNAKMLVVALEKPEEVVMHYIYELGSQRMAIRVAIDLGIFKILTSRNGNPISSKELAAQTQAEVLLVVRIMRVLVAIQFAGEDGKETYVATPLTRAIAKPASEAGLRSCHDGSSLVQMRMHDYFRGHGYTCPTNEADCAFQWIFGTQERYFEYIHRHPQKVKDFNTFMGGIRETRKHWTDWYPVEEQLLDGFPGGEEILLVDVGGGNGHDLEKFMAKYPESKGHLMLQDLPVVIEGIAHLSEGIQSMPHDIFQHQAIKGARAYFLHFVLHDWPDDRCREILQNLKSAMKLGHSKILIGETILPDTNCSTFAAALDCNMMAILAGMERSRSHWFELVESVGLKVASIQVSPFFDDLEGVIEVVL
ncbi:S-adenosyl-L-methionine-dependent methyltransferase [Viridothelium virens]|uniref:S-adenosyl-L-methionine-dependent methyltransferase n=1 Tax=Viridothelium virens TaxID=1048519 RepID=A0A6A6H9X6_VIRVR|nr:S-adenosyl-L-methionine-dependent methyltransferase [Viridothelium virens]